MGKKWINYVKFNQQELDNYTKDSTSCIEKVCHTFHIGFPPHGLMNPKEALLNIIDQSKIGLYDETMGGIVLAAKNIQILSNLWSIRYDDPELHFDVRADFYNFKPTIGATITGIVNYISKSHLGVVIYRVFNVSIKLLEGTDRSSVETNKEIRFKILDFDLQNKLPYIKGELIDVPLQTLKDKGSSHRIVFDSDNENQVDDSGISTEEMFNEVTVKKEKVMKLKPALTLNDTTSSEDSSSEEETSKKQIKKVIRNRRVKQEKVDQQKSKQDENLHKKNTNLSRSNCDLVQSALQEHCNNNDVDSSDAERVQKSIIKKEPKTLKTSKSLSEESASEIESKKVLEYLNSESLPSKTPSKNVSFVKDDKVKINSRKRRLSIMPNESHPSPVKSILKISELSVKSISAKVSKTSENKSQFSDSRDSPIIKKSSKVQVTPLQRVTVKYEKESTPNTSSSETEKYLSGKSKLTLGMPLPPTSVKIEKSTKRLSKSKKNKSMSYLDDILSDILSETELKTPSKSKTEPKPSTSTSEKKNKKRSMSSFLDKALIEVLGPPTPLIQKSPKKLKK